MKNNNFLKRSNIQSLLSEDNAFWAQNQGIDYRVEKPDKCPYCGNGIFPAELFYHFYGSSNNMHRPYAAILYQCPRCKDIFLAKNGFRDNNSYVLNQVIPNAKEVPSIPKELKDYYPTFYDIYTQALQADSYKLDKICGIGYRKAIEYLVKGYLTNLDPDNKDVIWNDTLGRNIKQIPNENIRNLARAITFIGNDETHPIKNNPEYDIEHMKRFIKAFCHLIWAEIVANVDAAPLANKPKK